MRGWWVISVLALAGCGVNQGWNPNYQFGKDPYGQYQVAREVALMTDTPSPETIPVALPVEAPTGAQIAGRSPVPPPPTMGVTAATTNVPATTATPEPAALVTLSQYALSQKQDPGTQVYARRGGSASVAAKACASYPNPDAAQLAFLAAGGPKSDPRGMDPDGDGYVCSWSPLPFRDLNL